MSRFDGRTFTTFTTEDGLADNHVETVFQDREGYLWFGTFGGGVSRFDGQAFTTFTTEDGLADNHVETIFQDREGHLWFGTWGGASRYDGQIFQNLTREDGLAHNMVRSIYQDWEGNMWFGAFNGLTRYNPPMPSQPQVFIDAVVADRRYEGKTALEIPSSTRLTTFEFHGMSLKTRPEAMGYQYQLEGHDPEWHITHTRRVEYQDLGLGKYMFRLRGVDRDLNYSAPAEISFQIVPDPRDERIDELEERVRERTRELEEIHHQLQEAQAQIIDELEEELQTAHDLQMGLMPKEALQIEGFDITGRCLPANHVGGDFFQYFQRDGQLSICLADVTGHAMKAAVPVMMFSGVLKTEMRLGAPLDQLFSNLNNTMYDSLDSRTFVCFTMGEVDLTERSFRLANSGCPYPFHFRVSTGDVSEMQGGRCLSAGGGAAWDGL